MGGLELVGVLVALVLCVPEVRAQNDPPRIETLEQGRFTLRHQPAEDIYELVRDQLSGRGSVELQRESNTVIVTDAPKQVSAILHLLREYDHPVEALDLEIVILRASKVFVGPSGAPTHPPRELAQKLGKMLSYKDYRVLGEIRLSAREGQSVSYEVGPDYRVGFRVGTLLSNQRLKLHNFKISSNRAPEGAKPLYHSHTYAWLDRPFAVTLQRDEKSQSALVVAVTCSRLESDTARSSGER